MTNKRVAGRRGFIHTVVAAVLLPSVSSLFKNENMHELPSAFRQYKGQTTIGFNLLLWTSYVSEKMNPMAVRLKGIGYDGVEVAMAEPADKPYKEFGKFLKGIDMDVSAVLAVTKEEDPVHPSSQVRGKALSKLKWAVDRANDLGATIICGPMHSAFANFSRQPPSDDEYKRSAEILHKAGEYAAASNVVFAVEAINRFECYLCNTVAQLKRLVEMSDHPNVRPMFDTHHANLEEKNFDTALGILQDSLAHVHISENDRGTPGDGHIDWELVFSSLRKINYQGWLTIESFSRNDTEFANAINVWREYSEPWDVATKGYSMIKRMQARYKL